MDDKSFYDRLIEIGWLDQGASYEWDEWHAYYDPETRKYFTGEGSGCSCDYYRIEDAVDQSNGLHSKGDVLASLNRYADESYSNVKAEAAEVQAKIMQWTPPKAKS